MPLKAFEWGAQGSPFIGHPVHWEMFPSSSHSKMEQRVWDRHQACLQDILALYCVRLPVCRQLLRQRSPNKQPASQLMRLPQHPVSAIQGSDGTWATDFASAMTGSPGLYAETEPQEEDWWGNNGGRRWKGGRSPLASINFIAAHDGFTLADLVSFNDKHNEANGEENRQADSLHPYRLRPSMSQTSSACLARALHHHAMPCHAKW